jgi:AmmeMemoRadiSam system protein A
LCSAGEGNAMSPPSDSAREDLELYRRQEFSDPERADLLALSHEAILSMVEHREMEACPCPPHWDQHRGAFTTIYIHGRLRGCVGYPLPLLPLRRTIIETARGAAFEDRRFSPVNAEESRQLEVSLSILSALKSVSFEEVQIGVHGLLISQAGHRGLLLPQVPVEHGWDRITFLEQTCRKAGLPADAWRSGATIETFTAEVFADKDRHS